MFGLTDKIFGNHRGISCFISNHRNFSRASKHINTNAAIQHAFCLSHKPIARAYQEPGRQRLHLANRGSTPARVLVLGGTPFGEELVMWWNFVGRSHDEIAAYREQWQNHDARFGAVDGYRGSLARLPAPPLPNGRLRPRANPGV